MDESLLALIDQLAERIGDPVVLADVEAVYADVDEALAVHQPSCDRSGRCCRFAEFGHCLFLTTPELIHFVSKYRARPAPPGTDWPTIEPMLDAMAADPAERCPFQAGDLCGVREIRPLGCRLFFCRPGSEKWGRSLYEQFQGRMKAICLARLVPYAYVEWTGALVRMLRGRPDSA